jgi:pyruvate/2-oxoglutarate dehydrogenase complex dihydrolipoamide acyltransferase (E2) component
MELKLSDLSEKVESAVVTLWHVAEDGRVSKDQSLFEIATDKATFDVPSPCDGTLTKIVKEAGAEVKTGETIAVIQEDRS